MNRSRGKWIDKVDKKVRSEKAYLQDVQLNVREDLQKVKVWKDSVFEKEKKDI